MNNVPLVRSIKEVHDKLLHQRREINEKERDSFDVDLVSRAINLLDTAQYRLPFLQETR